MPAPWAPTRQQEDMVTSLPYFGPYERIKPGPNGMGPRVVASHQRARIYSSLGAVLARRGYRAATVADVLRLAGVSRRAFYEHFDSKEQCFASAYRIAAAIDETQRLEAGA